MDYVNYCDTRLDASLSGLRDLSLGVVCDISGSPSTSVEQEEHSCWPKVGNEIRDVVRGKISLDVLW